MASWEDELDVDLSHIWQADPKPIHPQPDNQVIADNPDDLAFPSQPPQPAAAAGAAGAPTQRIQSLRDDPQTTRVTRLSQVAVTRLQSANAADLEDVDIADAPTQVAEPFVSRSAGLTAPLPPLPSFQVVVSRESGDTVPLATPSLEGEQRLRNPAKGSGSGSGSGGDIRRYFTQGGGGGGGGSRRKTRIPGPVGDLLLQKEGGGGDSEEERGGVDERMDECNDRVFRKGAWICALQSLGVAEFDPARYAILNVTASCIGSSRLNQRVPHFVAVIKELTPNVFGDAAVMLKDPTGTVAGMMNNQVFSNTDFARAISPGAVVILKQVAVFSPSVHYLNITIGNVVQVFPANTDLPQASAPKQEPLSQKRKLLQPDPKPLQEKPPPQLLEPTPGSSPQQAQPQPSPPQQAQPQPSPPPQEPTKASDVAAKAGSWDLLSPSPPREPSPPNEGGIAAAAKMAGWGDLTDDMEALLNEDVDDFYK